MKRTSHILPYLLTSLCILTSCGVYNSQFQCRAGNGLNCVAAGEVVDLIVEKEEGEDLFFKNSVEANRSKENEKSKKSNPKKKQDTSKKLIIMKDEEGNLVLSPEVDENSYR
jgi:hypothetical protein